MVTTKLEATRRLVRGSSASSSAARRAACRRFRVGSAGGCGVSGRPRAVAVRSSKVFEWENDTGEGTASDPSEVLSGLADKVKTEAPFLGLLTKLISPQGVSKGELTYQEFSRSLYENVTSQFHISCENLEKKYGETAGIRGCIYCLWLACFGTGVLKGAAMSQACGKLRQNEDLSYFIELFEYQKEEALDAQAKNGVESPRVTPEDRMRVAVDNLCSLMNVKEIDAETQTDFYEVVSACFPSSEPSTVKNVIATHKKESGSA